MVDVAILHEEMGPVVGRHSHLHLHAHDLAKVTSQASWQGFISLIDWSDVVEPKHKIF